MQGLLSPARLFNAADAALLCSLAAASLSRARFADLLSKAYRFR